MTDPPTSCTCTYIGDFRSTDNDCPTHGYRIALRPDREGELDDVVVCNVSMFRMERMSDTTFWMACYFFDSAERICFHVHGKDIHASFSEAPDGEEFRYEAGSMVGNE